MTDEELKKFSDYELHLYAGLVDVGINEDNDQQWYGTNRHWNEYTRLAKMKDKL